MRPVRRATLTPGRKGANYEDVHWRFQPLGPRGFAPSFPLNPPEGPGCVSGTVGAVAARSLLASLFEGPASHLSGNQEFP